MPCLNRGPRVLKFCGFELELNVETVLERQPDQRAVFSATDALGEHWLIVEEAAEEDRVSWLCAPVSARMLELVGSGRAATPDAVRHSRTGWVEVVRVIGGRTVPDQRLLCSELVTRAVSGTGALV